MFRTEYGVFGCLLKRYVCNFGGQIITLQRASVCKTILDKVTLLG